MDTESSRKIHDEVVEVGQEEADALVTCGVKVYCDYCHSTYGWFSYAVDGIPWELSDVRCEKLDRLLYILKEPESNE